MRRQGAWCGQTLPSTHTAACGRPTRPRTDGDAMVTRRGIGADLHTTARHSARALSSGRGEAPAALERVGAEARHLRVLGAFWEAPCW